MTDSIAGINELHLLASTRIGNLYRGLDERSGQRVLFLAHQKNINASLAENVYRNEFSITQLPLGDVQLKSQELRRTSSELAVVYKDCSALPLAQHLNGTPLDIEKFFNMSLHIVNALVSLHSKNMIHGNLNPSSILLGDEKAYFFSFRDRFKLSTPQYKDTLDVHYISPEHTGRVNQGVDQRSDLYSLGVCFYQMLTGCLPFKDGDEQALVHAHLALRPKEVKEINPQVPSALSSLVSRLLEKDPEARYQSARGLFGDILECQQLSKEDGQSFEFLPKIQSFADYLVFPEVLFGREKELAALKQALTNSLIQKSRLSIIVEARAGLGKTQLVKELLASVDDKDIFILKGQCERGAYSALASLIENFSHHYQNLAAVNQVELSQNLPQAMGDGELEQLQLLVPDLARLPDFGSAQSSVLSPEKLRDAFVHFLQALASFRFLILALDNLHECDRESLSVLRQVLDSSDGQGVLTISTMDLSSDGAMAPSMELQIFQKVSVLLHLKNLNLEHVQLFLEKTLQVPEIEAFSEIILEKTMGNPSYIRYLLEQLVEEGILHRSGDGGSWDCDLESLRSRKVMDSVAELLVTRIVQLKGELHELALKASCLPERFSPQSLAYLSQMDLAKTYQAIQILLGQGLLAQDDLNHFSFSHESIRKELYKSLDEQEKQNLHGKLAELGINDGSLKTGQELLILANHIERSGDFIKGPRAAKICFDAASSRMHLKEWAKALRLLDKTISLAEDDKDLLVSARLTRIQIFRDSQDFIQARDQIRALKSENLDSNQKVQVLLEEARLQKALGQKSEAVKVILNALVELNIQTDTRKSRFAQWRLRRVYRTLLRAKEKVELSLKQRLSLEAFSLVIQLPSNCRYELYEYCLLEGTRLQLLSGLTDFNFQPLCALYLIEKGELKLARSMLASARWTAVVWADVHPTVFENAHMFSSSSVLEAVHSLGQLLDSAVASKDISLARAASLSYFEGKLYSGQNLVEIDAELSQLLKAHSDIFTGITEITEFHEFLSLLLGRSKIYSVHGNSRRLYQDFATAVLSLEIPSQSGQGSIDQRGLLHTSFGLDSCVTLFTECFVYLKKGLVIEARSSLEKFVCLSEVTPWNLEAPKAILEALCFKDSGFEKGVSLFEKAIAENQKFGNKLLLAVAYEEASHFYLDHDCQSLSLGMLEQARRLYEAWGSLLKSQQMTSGAFEIDDTEVSLVGDSMNLDLQTITQATHYITSEMEMGPLIEKLTQTLMEAAGATHGSLFLVEDSKATLKADCYYNEDLVYKMTPKDQLREAAALIPARLIQMMINRQNLIVIDDASNDKIFAQDAMVVQAGFRSILCLPIVSSGDLKAFVCLRNDMAPGFFTTGRIKTLEILSGQAAIAVENAELYESLAEKVRMETELITAGHVQSTILPRPEYESALYSIRGMCESATECGGDWWYYNQIGNKLTLCIGDATGHGVSAALLTSAVRSAVSVLEAFEDLALSDMMKRLNKVICAASNGDVAMTFFIARLDLESGEIECCNASHPFPFKVAGEKLSSLLVRPGPMLGQSADGLYTVEKIKLAPGDQLIFFTDGLTELMNTKGQMLGDAKLSRHLRKNLCKTEESFDCLAKLVQEHRQDQDLADDLTYYVLKFKHHALGSKNSLAS